MKKQKRSVPAFSLESQKKKDLPPYVTVNGVYYEKITGKTVNLDLDLDPDVQALLIKKMKDGFYVNEQELIRHAIREAIKERGL